MKQTNIMMLGKFHKYSSLKLRRQFIVHKNKTNGMDRFVIKKPRLVKCGQIYH